MQPDLTKTVAQRMTQIRKSKNLKQSDVASALGINQQNYSHYEQGLRVIPLKRVSALADILGVAVEEILGLTEKKPKRGPTSQLENSFERVKRLPRPKQKEIINVVDALIQKAS